ncbi:MAG TPA: hypothetical protein VF544_20895 [Pyrinomonadaceae bacterium]
MVEYEGFFRGMTEGLKRQTPSRRARPALRAASVCLLVALFCVTAQQLSTRANLLLPQQAEQEFPGEEIQEGKVKAVELTAASRRKALPQSLRALAPALNRALFQRIEERRSAVAFHRSAHTYRRRGPPRPVPLS